MMNSLNSFSFKDVKPLTRSQQKNIIGGYMPNDNCYWCTVSILRDENATGMAQNGGSFGGWACGCGDENEAADWVRQGYNNQGIGEIIDNVSCM